MSARHLVVRGCGSRSSTGSRTAARLETKPPTPLESAHSRRRARGLRLAMAANQSGSVGESNRNAQAVDIRMAGTVNLPRHAPDEDLVRAERVNPSLTTTYDVLRRLRRCGDLRRSACPPV